MLLLSLSPTRVLSVKPTSTPPIHQVLCRVCRYFYTVCVQMDQMDHSPKQKYFWISIEDQCYMLFSVWSRFISAVVHVKCQENKGDQPSV